MPAGHEYIIDIPENVERIIRRYIALLPHNEWSGALFYTVEGDFDSPVLKVICKDILIMDIGEGAHTQFNTERLIADYMAEKPELLDCYNGLIHSHHIMGAFFSGEDTGTLLQEGINRNNFVSLVVDTRGTYVAAITRRIEVKTTFTPHSTAAYPFFALRNVPVEVGEEPAEVVREHHNVQCFPLTVVRHEVSDFDEYVDKFAELLQPMLRYKGAAAHPTTPYQPYNAATAAKPSTPATPSLPAQAPNYHTPSYGGYAEAREEDEVDYPKLPFPGGEVKEDLPEGDGSALDDWALAVTYKPKLAFNKKLFEQWLIVLFSGTPLALLTEHLMWTTQMVERMLESWRESLNEEDFEEYCATWIPLYVSKMNQKDFFEANVLVDNPELDEFTLGQIFFLHLRDVFTNDLDYDVYVETIFGILKEEFDYPEA